MSTIKNIVASPPLFDKDDWPVNPATGEAYSPDEIRTNPNIPYPLFVDAANPGPYWSRRTPAELASQKGRIAKKSKKRGSRRGAHQTTTRLISMKYESSAGRQAKARGQATVELVSRVNEGSEESGDWQDSLADLAEVISD